ncbi:putative uncharacterized protein DDB_G0289963 [Adelges cooleyi]|uniref:putative uncharacterized protein DDB_G0289963 n=1 Tax=Adelges cooleyi TaxID=133065 RepID=UPI0021806233|nr:putative uncharacterized protein DDB_G0289963 [Adelges cooleyi]
MFIILVVVVIVVSSVNSQQNEHFGNSNDYYGQVQRPSVHTRSNPKSVESQKGWSDRLGMEDSRLLYANQRGDVQRKNDGLKKTVDTAVNGAYGHRWIQRVRAPSTPVDNDENNRAIDDNRSNYNVNADSAFEYGHHSHDARQSALPLQRHHDLEEVVEHKNQQRYSDYYFAGVEDQTKVNRPEQFNSKFRPAMENVNVFTQSDNEEKSKSPSSFNHKTNDNRNNIINRPIDSNTNNERDVLEHEEQKKTNAHRANKLNDEDKEWSKKLFGKNFINMSESQSLPPKLPSTQNWQTDRTVQFDELEKDDNSSGNVKKAIAPTDKDVFVDEDDGSYWVVTPPPPVTFKKRTAPLINEERPKESWKSYSFDYAVRDDYSGANFGQWERRDPNGGGLVTGQYRVQLPDGRTQTVAYTVDPVTGYRASVTYKGIQHHPAPVPHPLSVPPVSRTSERNSTP